VKVETTFHTSYSVQICRTVIETATPGKIPVISTNRHLLANSLPSPKLFRGASVWRKVSRQQTSPVKLGVFNARSVSTSGKIQTIASLVKDCRPVCSRPRRDVARRTGHAVSGRVRADWLRLHKASATKICRTGVQHVIQPRRSLSATSRSTSRAARLVNSNLHLLSLHYTTLHYTLQYTVHDV